MYNLIKPIFFKYDPEEIHHKVFNWIKSANKFPGASALIRSIYCLNDKRLEREVFGIKFKNPVGLAAGFDKDAKLFEELDNFGFGFIEVGTITPVAQPGNDKPRMFRLIEDEALINRMGFNNEGVDEMVNRLKNRKNRSLIIGGNIGKNKVTPNEEADDDFVKCFEKLFDYVDYFVVNVSSPNTPGLRDLQDKEPLKKLLFRLQTLNTAKPKSKPILLKIAPDLTNEQLDDIIEIVQETKIAGVIATNTTISREGLNSDQELVKQMGGLSGKPVRKRSTEVIRYLSEKSNKAFPIIGVGGIHSGEDAIEKLKAGASLVQIYTGFIYEGPGLVKKINEKILEKGL
ncbi:quinone-dependent dihydroorotate dehydrogenase [Solitalea lacus]|uniref:quinone-dependent dihydroorotate dehydrogenase n=1 Tax=Solitalea lacus TaxID=2911172 RepID=UPI001EDAC078|nr:quinone-dependent dihydroorotate dehydrogenase [Solitalea lacus]UKJ06456.1 quinone-dependent dihydroorotate dehydrogenase [Solitalea lacus]